MTNNRQPELNKLIDNFQDAFTASELLPRDVQQHLLQRFSVFCVVSMQIMNGVKDESDLKGDWWSDESFVDEIPEGYYPESPEIRTVVDILNDTFEASEFLPKEHQKQLITKFLTYCVLSMMEMNDEWPDDQEK